MIFLLFHAFFIVISCRHFFSRCRIVFLRYLLACQTLIICKVLYATCNGGFYFDPELSSFIFFAHVWALFASLDFSFRLYRRLHKQTALGCPFLSQFIHLPSFLTCFYDLLWDLGYADQPVVWQKMAPDLKRKVDATRAAREAREAEMKKQIDAQVKIFFSVFLFGTAFYWANLLRVISVAVGFCCIFQNFLVGASRSCSELIISSFFLLSRLVALNHQKWWNLSGSTVLPQGSDFHRSSRVISLGTIADIFSRLLIFKVNNFDKCIFIRCV